MFVMARELSLVRKMEGTGEGVQVERSGGGRERRTKSGGRNEPCQENGSKHREKTGRVRLDSRRMGRQVFLPWRSNFHFGLRVRRKH